MHKIDRFYKANCFLFVSIACFALGLTAHAFAFTNLFPTHDSLYNQYFDTLEYLHQISLGRFCLPVYVELTASVATLPFSVGVISLLYLSIFSCIIVKCFNLNLLAAISVCGIVVTNRTIIALTATYMPWLGADCLAVLLAGIAFSFWLKTYKSKLSNSWKHLIVSGICLFLTLSLYQAMISVFLVLIAFQCLKDLIAGKNAKTVFSRGFRAALTVLIAGFIYFCTFKAIMLIGNIQIPQTYNSLSNLSSNQEPLSSRIINTYIQVFSLFFGSNIASAYPVILIKVIDVILLLISLFLISERAISSKISKSSLLIIIILVVSLPFSSNACRVLNNETHDLMYFGIWLLALFPVLVREEPQYHSITHFLFYTASICCLVLTAANIQTANLAYQTKCSEYNATNLLMNEITSKIEEVDNYVEGETTVVFIGSIRNTIVNQPEEARVSKITGMSSEYFATTGSDQAYLKPGSIDRYYQNVLMRKPLIRASTDEDISLAQNHPSYPDKNSIWVENKTVYVKL